MTKQMSSLRTSQVAEEPIPRLENPYLPAKRFLSLDRPYTEHEIPADIKREVDAERLDVPLPHSVNTKEDPGKGVRRIHRNLFSNISMNLVNH